jgi:hypothetical protein
MGRSHTLMGSSATWNATEPNILAPPVLDRIRRAITEDWIAGLHLHLGGGGSGDNVAFSRYDEFLSHVTDSRPGDLFILWSIAEMRKRGLLLVDKHFSSPKAESGPFLSNDELDRIRVYLLEEKHNEVLGVGSSGSEKLTAVVTDLDGTEESRFVGVVRRAAVSDGSLCILPLTRIDNPEFHLAKGKRPNAHGNVPSGGSY